MTGPGPDPDSRTEDEKRVDELLAVYDRTFITWRGLTFIRSVLLLPTGFALGLVLGLGLAVAGRAGLVVVTLLQLALLLVPVLALLLLLLSLLARRVRRAAWWCVRAWVVCLGALFVLKGLTLFLDSGMRDVL